MAFSAEKLIKKQNSEIFENLLTNISSGDIITLVSRG